MDKNPQHSGTLELELNDNGLFLLTYNEGKKKVIADTLLLAETLLRFEQHEIESALQIAGNLLYNNRENRKVRENRIFDEFAHQLVQPSKFHNEYSRFISQITFTLNGMNYSGLEAVIKQKGKNDQEKNHLRKNLYGIYLNLSQFYDQNTKLYNGSSKIPSLEQGEYSEVGEKIYFDKFYFKYLWAVNDYNTIYNKVFTDIKSFQNDNEMEVFLNGLLEEFDKVIETFGINRICVIPNNVARRKGFNNFFLNTLMESYKDIGYIKVIKNNFPGRQVQKTLRSISARISNAERLFTISSKELSRINMNDKILLIDDTFGSGATINTVAKKIKLAKPNTEIIALTFLGSYRSGFDVSSLI